MKQKTILFVALICCAFYCATAQQSSSNADVIGIGIAPDGLGYDGRCPVMVHFKATVYLTRVPIVVRYYWERNGVRTKTQSVELSADAAPKLNVKTDWAVGTPGKKYNATARLHVLTDAGEVVSDTKESPGSCWQSAYRK